ncbi:MAG: DUF4982 domain-containing protein [Bacteroidales bacterium]|nr:DUF4982 domain-containing protein [Bacteroidales bacterium]
MKRCALLLSLLLMAATLTAREKIRLDAGWEFAFGNASSPALDFGCGTEYFTYLTKAASIHNEGPYSPKFDKSKWPAEWKTVDLPHDWVVDLPFAKEASHSHGYKTVGYQYPETSVGWYRKSFTIPADDEGKHIWLRFDGIFRDARIWLNGFYLGHEPSGYATQIYDISEYLNYGGENLVCVRADATLEEGWFYEGAGIYRHVWLEKAALVHVAPFGTFVHTQMEAPYDQADVVIETTVRNSSATAARFILRHILLDASDQPVATGITEAQPVLAQADAWSALTLPLSRPHLWSPADPYLYKVLTEVIQDGVAVDSYETRIGIRDARFDPDHGFLLNGERLELKGVNMHQDHPGVGTGIPDALQVYRLRQLKKMGVNAYRSSHNPMTPEMLDACDSLGVLVMEENRLTGVNEEHVRLLRRMIQRDRNHPSIVLWSVGNEEWAIEWNDKGRKIVETMREYCHRADPTRPMCVATSSGPSIVIPADVAGYNYMTQNPIDQHRADYPLRCAVGSEETSGCGTRGVYFAEPGRMPALNRVADTDGQLNRIERGWQFYAARPWLGGLFFWTGFDYRGEPNPLEFPATGSQFGILDYCGFPKDEAWYLKAWWTDEPVLHILPHWNLAGHEGENVSIWVYSNCDEVSLVVNGRNLGRKKMPEGGHLEWDAVYKPGKVVATAYKKGKRVLAEVLETTGPAARLDIEAETIGDVTVCTVRILDRKGRFVPDACLPLQLDVDGSARILGVGNGDPAFQAPERPSDPSARSFTVDSFNGLAQVLLQGSGTLKVSTPDNTLTPSSFMFFL